MTAGPDHITVTEGAGGTRTIGEPLGAAHAPGVAGALSGLGAELGALASDIGTLVRAEAKLAVEEVSDRAKRYAAAAAKVAVGGVVLLIGAVILLVGLIVALAEVIGLLLSLLVVGAVFAVAGFFLVNSARNALKNVDLVPHRAINRVERDVQQLKESL